MMGTGKKEAFEGQMREILSSPRSGLRLEEPMSRHTTFRIGGPARWFAVPGSEEELAGLIRLAQEKEIPWKILGNGSNLLVSDQGFSGLVISLEENWNQISRVEDGVLRAGGGALLSRIAAAALKESLTGMEFAAGIPGTLGGAVVMNAGAYGGEMKDILRRVRVMDARGEAWWMDPKELELGYRTSCVARKGYLVLEAELALTPGDSRQIRARMDDLAARRREKQPLEYPSAGSTFKRPEGHFAGQLIDQAGLRGFRVGDAQVSEKHCGFVVNRGQAKAADVMELCRQVRQRVLDQAGVELELEIRCWGDF